MHDFTMRRRQFLALAAGFALGPGREASASAADSSLQQLSTDTLAMSYYAAGPEDGRPVVLLHDLGGGIDSVTSIAAMLASRGMRVFVPSLHEQGARDMVAFLNALHTPEAVFAGIGHGARLASAFAAFKPTRCVGLVVTEKAPQSALAFADAIAGQVRSAKWRT
jgi:pimeloyl-ACP methyl ester carboxylesterase